MNAPLEKEETRFAEHLATLDEVGSQPAARAEALKQLALMFLHSRQNEELLHQANVELLNQLADVRAENSTLREYRRKVSALTLGTLDGVLFVQAPGHSAPATPPRLALVKPEGSR